MTASFADLLNGPASILGRASDPVARHISQQPDSCHRLSYVDGRAEMASVGAHWHNQGQVLTGNVSAAEMCAAAHLEWSVSARPVFVANGVDSIEGYRAIVRDVCRTMRQRPMFGNGWQVIIVNECDRMTPQAETIWLDALEQLPPRCVVVFSTNSIGKLSQRFQDRCQSIRFESAPTAGMMSDARRLLSAVWTTEKGTAPDREVIGRIGSAAVIDGQFSFRRALQMLQPALCA